jgi:hypothetical protein
MMRPTLARFFVRLFPRAWRRRYEDEVLDLLCQSETVRWRDLFDLLRSAADAWDHDLARTRWRPAKVVALAYVTLLAVWAMLGVGGNLLAILFLGAGVGFSRPDLGFLVSIPAVAVVFMMPLFLTGLALNLPFLAALRLARNYLPLWAARSVAAAGLAIWAEWALFQMEWFDVWRHGVPGPAYWLTTLVPWGAAFASAGAVLGGAVVTRRGGVPAMSQSSE